MEFLSLRMTAIKVSGIWRIFINETSKRNRWFTNVMKIKCDTGKI